MMHVIYHRGQWFVLSKRQFKILLNTNYGKFPAPPIDFNRWWKFDTLGM